MAIIWAAGEDGPQRDMRGQADFTGPLESLKAAIVFSPRDWSLDSADAWIYGIVVGWNTSLREVSAKHGWTPETVNRLRRLHSVAKRMAKKDGEK